VSNELDHIRSFRTEYATVDPDSVRAARAALLAHIAAGGTPEPDSRSALRRRHFRWMRTGRQAVAGAASVVVVTAVVAIVGMAGGHDAGRHVRGAAARSRQQLVGLLGVLRRGQTPADRAFDATGWPYPGPAPGNQPGYRIEPDRPLIRLATVTSWGAKVFVVPLTSPRDPRLVRTLGETVALWVQGIGWSDYSTVADLRTGGAAGPESTVRGPDGKPISRLFDLVPDHVATVRYFLYGDLPQPGKVLRFTGSITAIVHHNIATFQQDTAGSKIPFEIWYAPDGRVVRRSSAWQTVRRVGDHYVVKASPRPELLLRRGAPDVSQP
jgi:hypothetical protein